MDHKEAHHLRLYVLAALFFIVAAVYIGVLYDTQVNNYDYYYASSVRSIARSETVEAARGDILDRYGRVLVSNRVTYQVALNTDAMEKNRNDILLALIRIARDAGVEWEDTLPITAQPPFRYTTDTPFQYPTTDEEGSPTTSLTRLGRLAVKMKWIDDPTADGAQGAPLPTAEELLEKMRESFQLELEGADMRAVAGVLYELYYRSMVNSWPPYVFAEGVDIDFISKVKEQGLSGVEIEAATVRTYNTSDGRYWAVDITDRGLGMNKSETKKIFEDFYRVPTGDVHNIKGHGLGLAYSKKIVELHGGVIEVESSPGKGSTFTVKIPLD